MNEIIYGARHRITGEWFHKNGSRVTQRCAGDIVWAGSLRGVLTDACRFVSAYRIVRIRKVKRRVPAPSKRLAAWVQRFQDRLILWRPTYKGNVHVESRGSAGIVAYGHGPTPAAAMRALVAAMGKEVDE